MRYYSKKQTGGFTLIELMIVVVILGLLATILMPKILDKPEKARRVKAQADIRQIETALAAFMIETGRSPTTAEGLQALVADPGVENYNPKGYLEKVPVDPWGRPYMYLSPAVHGSEYDLESYGKDKEDGGSGDGEDIESWNLN